MNTEKKIGPKNRPNKQNSLSYLLIITLILAGIFTIFQGQFNKEKIKIKEITLSELLQKYNNKELKEIKVSDTTLEATPKNPEFIKNYLIYKTTKEKDQTISDLELTNTEQDKTTKIQEISNKEFIVILQEKTFEEKKDVENITLIDLQEKYNSGEIAEIYINEVNIIAIPKKITSQKESLTTDIENTKDKDSSLPKLKYKAIKEPNMNVAELGLLNFEINKDKATTIKSLDSSGSKMWTNVLLSLLPLLLLIGLLVFISRKAGNLGGDGGPFGFGKSKAKTYDKTKHKTKFKDVAGAEEVKEEVFELVDFLKLPKKYQKVGAKIPRGILLVGPPGTGKTLLARAIAGEADVPFFAVSGSEFVEMFVGVGASRVRDLFKTAKRNSPAIIFIDEIDAIGKQRGAGNGGGHDEREQTLNQILTEMDGFEPNSSVIIVAATNRPDTLDKALLRPGRFDRRVHIDLPDLIAREKILKVHTKGKTIEKKLDLRKIASKTVGFSGADLENIMNEAAIASVKHEVSSITQQDLENAVEKVAMGPERKSRRISEEERRIIAYHEVGHALSGHFTKNCEPVHKISIISRGSALGVTWFLPEEDKYLQSENKMKDEMISLHGGRIAERLIFGQTTTGSSNDLERITNIARRMVMTYGMAGGDIGPVVFSERSHGFAGLEFNEKEYSESMASKIDAYVRDLILEAEANCLKILEEQKELLHIIAKDLLEKETISRTEFLVYLNKIETSSDKK